MTDPDLTSDGYGDDEPPPIGHNAPPKTYEEEVRAEHQALFLRLDALRLEQAKLPKIINSDAELETVGKFVIQARTLTKDVEAAHKKVSQFWKDRATTCDKVFLKRGLVGDIATIRDVVQAIADDFTTRKEQQRRRELEAAAEALREQAENVAYEAAALEEAGAHNVAEVLESQSEHTEKAADRLEAKAQGSASAVLRTRFEGVTASGRTVWSYEIEDADKIDLNLLRKQIQDHELAQYIQRFIDAGGRELPGVSIFERTVSTFR